MTSWFMIARDTVLRLHMLDMNDDFWEWQSDRPAFLYFGCMFLHEWLARTREQAAHTFMGLQKPADTKMVQGMRAGAGGTHQNKHGKKLKITAKSRGQCWDLIP
jgi:hypothetical protein